MGGTGFVRGKVGQALGVAGAVVALAGCAVNPATGKRQLMLVSESDEIRIGRENDKAIVQQFGLYDDDALASYVSGIGHELAAASERPDLDWTFRVLDDTLVNAFALPGGYIYVTRGILAYFDDEAQLASVLGHEIGHVTARHGASQMSKAQLAQLGLAAGSVAVPDQYSGVMDLANVGTQLLFLKYSRDDERQADDLGLRYIVREGYDPRPMGQVFLTLKRVSESTSSGSMPGWLSTHPDPVNREGRISDEIARLDTDLSSRRVARDEYLRRIDGIVFGNDPREGYFVDTVFYHPGLRVKLDFPSGWQTVNTRSRVAAQSAENDAAIYLSLAEEDSVGAALGAFRARDSVSPGETWSRSIHGLSATGSPFTFNGSSGSAAGEVAFVEHQGNVFQILGLSNSSAWSARRAAVEATFDSFAPLTDRTYLDVTPDRVELVSPDRSMSVEEFAAAFGATVSASQLAILNGLDPGTRLIAGRSYKVVRGGRTPGKR